MRWIYLNHFLSSSTPGYAGKVDFVSEKTKDMCCGNSCNQVKLTLSNHVGTHIDAPRHFSKNGKTLDQFSAGDWIFSNIDFHDLKIHEEGVLINQDHFTRPIKKDCDLLLIKTGFEKVRSEEKYWKSGPGLSPSFGTFLRENIPSLRAVGLDFISVTSFQHRNAGKKAHLNLLGSNGVGKPIIPIEDMSLELLTSEPKQVVVAPMPLEDGDGAPALVLAKI